MTDLLLQALALASSLKANGGLDYCVIRANNIARDLLEEIIRQTENPPVLSTYEKALSDDSYFADYKLTREERQHILNNEFVSAVKSVRSRLNLGLKEAKDVCDGFRSKYYVYDGNYTWRLKP